LEQARAADPDYGRALQLRAQLHLEAGEPSAAAALLERAVKLAPCDDVCRHQLALAYHGLGRHAGARGHEQKLHDLQSSKTERAVLTRAVMKRPRDPALQARMAELYDRLDQPEQAARCRRNAALLQALPVLEVRQPAEHHEAVGVVRVAPR